MTLKGQRDLIFMNAIPVVHDAQQTLPTFTNFNFDFGCARIQAVLQQFLGNVGRAFDNLTCCNFGGHGWC